MTEMPEDIMKEAHEVIMKLRWHMIPVADFDHAKSIVAAAILADREITSHRAKQMERLEKAFDDMIMMVDFEKCKITIAFETAEETEAAQKALSEAIGWETIGETA